VVINQLRKKIEKDPTRPRYILTEPWLGYRFQLPIVASEKADTAQAVKFHHKGWDRIEIEISCKNIHARFAKESQGRDPSYASVQARATSSSFMPRFPGHNAVSGIPRPREKFQGPDPSLTLSPSPRESVRLDSQLAAFRHHLLPRSSKFLFVGPSCEPLLAVASYPVPAIGWP